MSSKPSAHQVVILAGGSGTRLWPLSRARQPKQLLKLAGDTTLLQQAVERVRGVATLPPLVVTTAAYAPLVRRQAPSLKASQIIIEPMGRGTAAAIAVAAAITQRRYPGAAMTVLNSDQVITNQAGFRRTVQAMAAAARTGEFAFAGVKPAYPETGYGYIEVSATKNRRAWYAFKRFHEKPDVATAQRYIRSQRFFWNPGIFCATADRWLASLQQHAPKIAAAAHDAAKAWGTPRFKSALAASYRKLKSSVAIDYAVMEKLKSGVVVPADFGWTDVGHWRSVHDVLSSKPGKDVVVGKHLGVDSGSNLIYAVSGRLIATVGLRDMVVVDTLDAVLICPRDQAQRVKELVAALEAPLLRRYR